MPGGVETLSERSKDQVQNLDGPQKLGILHDKPEVEQMVSEMCKALDRGCVTLTLNPLFIGD